MEYIQKRIGKGFNQITSANGLVLKNRKKSVYTINIKERRLNRAHTLS